MQNLIADGLVQSSSPGMSQIGRESNSLSAERLANQELSRNNLPQTEAGSGSFGELLQKSIQEVNTAQQGADVAIKELVSGRTKNIHETMLTIEKADLSMKMMMQVRNKILDAYREIMRMQV